MTSNGTPHTGPGLFKFALVTGSNASVTATATAIVSFGFVVNIAVNSPGSGYLTPPTVTLSGGGGSGAVATAIVSGGMVTGFTINSVGSGYTSPPTVAIAPPPPSFAYRTHWSNDGSSVAGGEPAIAVSAVVSNGLFAVDLGDTSLPGMAALDAGLFAQPRLSLRLWFNDGLNGFAPLDPPQRLTDAPTAGFAHRASTVASGGIQSEQLATNAVGSIHLQAGVVTGTKIAGGQVVRSLNGLTDGVTLAAGTNINLGVSGNTLTIGSTLSGFSWQHAAGLMQQGTADTGYIVTNTEWVSIVLPAGPPVGSRLRVVGAGAGGWKLLQNPGQSVLSGNVAPPIRMGESWVPRAFSTNWVSVASSADGMKLVAAVTNGQLYTSTDAGVTWTARESPRYWVSVASSSDGSRLYAAATAVGGSDRVYRSLDSGATWGGFSPPPGSFSRFLACSREWNLDGGIKLVAGFFGGGATSGQLWNCINPDFGGNWTQLFDLNDYSWRGAAASADGTRWVAVADDGQPATSSDSGASWTLRDSVRNWSAVAASADGTRFYATVAGGQIFASTNSGVTWAVLPGSYTANWSSIACSEDGGRLLAAARPGSLFVSMDFGASWTSRDTVRNWESVACSADGTKLVAAARGGQIYTSQATLLTTGQSTPGIYGSLTGGRGAAVELLYVGDGRFLPLSFVPPLSTY